MKVNFQFKNNFQIVNVEELNESFEQLKEKCQELTKENSDGLSISFLDIEKEEIKINDKHDYEYMISNINNENPLTLKIEKKEEDNLIEKKEENLKKNEEEEEKNLQKKKCKENENKIIKDDQNDIYKKSETFLILRKKSEDLEKVDKSVQIEKETCEVSIGQEKNIKKVSFGSQTNKKTEIIENIKNEKNIKTQENSKNENIVDNLKIEETLDFEQIDVTKEKIGETLDFEQIDITKEKIEEKEDLKIEGEIDFEDISMIQAPEKEVSREEKKKLRIKKKKDRKKTLLNEVIKKNEKLQNLEKKIDLLQNLILNTQENLTKKEKIKETGIINENIICKNCDKKNFFGKRYKCIICKNYNLCEDCEDKNIHKHPMIVIQKKINNFKLEEFTELNQIRSNFIYENLDTLKKTILVNLTDGQYPKHFYDSMIDNYKKFELGDFILEVIKIFA